jgi:hypothetical protein
MKWKGGGAIGGKHKDLLRKGKGEEEREQVERGG